MLARCARCQGTFTTDRFGRQFCPHCGSELILADPGAPQPPPAGGPPPAPPPPGGPGPGAPPAAGGGAAPPGAPPSYPPPPPPGGGWAPLPPVPPTPPSPGDEPSPFAELARRNFFGAYFETWKLASVEPQRFFARVRPDQIWPAVLFGVLSAWVGGAVSALFGLLTGMSTMAFLRQMMDKVPPEQAEMMEKLSGFLGGGFALLQIILVPVLAFIGIFVMAGVVHLVLMLFKDAGRGFPATLTVVGYSYGVHLLDAVPGCGGLISVVWQVVILIIGLAAIQRTSTGKAAAAVLLPLFLFCCCCAGIPIIAALTAASHLGGAGGTANL